MANAGWLGIDIKRWHSNGSGNRSTGVIWTTSKSTVSVVITWYLVNLKSKKKAGEGKPLSNNYNRVNIPNDVLVGVNEILDRLISIEEWHFPSYFNHFIWRIFEFLSYLFSFSLSLPLSVQTHGLYLDQKILSIPMSLAVINAVISSYQQVRISNQYFKMRIIFLSLAPFLPFIRCVFESTRAHTHQR